MELKKRGIEYQSREEFVNREDYDAFTHIEKQRLIDILIESEKLDPRRIEFEEPKAEDKSLLKKEPSLLLTVLMREIKDFFLKKVGFQSLKLML